MIDYRALHLAGGAAIMRAVIEGDTARIDAWKLEAATLRAQL